MDKEIFEKASEAVSIESKFGHSDVGDVLVLWLKNIYTKEVVLEELDFLIEGYNRSNNQ